MTIASMRAGRDLKKIQARHVSLKERVRSYQQRLDMAVAPLGAAAHHLTHQTTSSTNSMMPDTNARGMPAPEVHTGATRDISRIIFAHHHDVHNQQG